MQKLLRFLTMVVVLFLVTGIGQMARAEEDSSDILLGAMKQELDRSMKKLTLNDFEGPYFVSYLLKEDTVANINGKFGAIMRDTGQVHRNLYVEVRVGDYVLDNSGRGGYEYSFAPGMGGGEEFKYIEAPIDNNPASLRNILWLLTDAKYKQALASYQAKKGQAIYLVEEKDSPNNFSREKAHFYRGPKLEYSVDKDLWRAIVREETEYLRTVPHLGDSSMNISFDEERKYFVNSEGSEVFTDELFFSLSARAETRAPDGMHLANSYTFYARSPEAIPDRKTLHEGVVRMADELLALREAKNIEPYTGPAILDPSVTGVFFHEAIGHRLEGERQKNHDEGQTFAEKVGQSILPGFLTIIDDPTREVWDGIYLNGHYKMDDEGIPAQSVLVVEKGVLRNYLMSRAPVKGFAVSNGHGRNGSYEDPMGRQGNLIVKSDREVQAARLKEMLLEEVRKQNKPYGLILKKASGGETSTGTYNFQAFRNRPTLIYKVDRETGEETLVRGAEIVGTPLVSVNKIMATGADYQVFNGFCGAESGYVPVSMITPSALVSEIELQKVADQPQRPPLLPPPHK